MKMVERAAALILVWVLSVPAPGRAEETAQEAWDRASAQTEEVLGVALSGASGAPPVLAAPPVPAGHARPRGYWGLHGPTGHHTNNDMDAAGLVENAGVAGHAVNLLSSPVGAAKPYVQAVSRAEGFFETASAAASVVTYPFMLLFTVVSNAVSMVDEAILAVAATIEGWVRG